MLLPVTDNKGPVNGPSTHYVTDIITVYLVSTPVQWLFDMCVGYSTRNLMIVSETYRANLKILRGS